MNAQQINGQRFNRLTVIRRAGTSKSGDAFCRWATYKEQANNRRKRKC